MLSKLVVKTQAWEQLHDAKYCAQLSMGELHDLMLRAGYPEEVAQRAANKRGWERLQAGVAI